MARTPQPVSCLDTHIVVWLYAGLVEKLSTTAQQAIETSVLLFSPVVALELQYLYEIGRVIVPPDVLLPTLEEEVGLTSGEIPTNVLIALAQTLSWTRDVFDRLIVANTMAIRGARLLTKDRRIRQHSPVAFW